jgi:two-component system OmpR family response regulator
MRILIVEDEPDLIRGLAKALREDGYAVDTAIDGDEGLYKATETAYDAIVLDVMLPHLNGFELLAQLRAKKSTPVLMLTARNRTPDRVRGLDTGADDYLAKPFDLDELLARLRALIRRCAGVATNTITAADSVVVDVGAKRVTRQGKRVELTAREYALVEFLAQRRGQVVSRTELYEHLFDENEATLSNLLDVHVSNIRKKLGSDFIVTRRGLGYSVA